VSSRIAFISSQGGGVSPDPPTAALDASAHVAACVSLRPDDPPECP
jgi:hypothetical protein